MYLDFDPLDSAEKDVLTFDFSAGLASGETLSGTPTATVTMYLGVDSSPSQLLNGSVQLDATQKLVLIPVQGRNKGCDYDIKVVAATTNPNKVLAMTGRLHIE